MEGKVDRGDTESIGGLNNHLGYEFSDERTSFRYNYKLLDLVHATSLILIKYFSQNIIHKMSLRWLFRCNKYSRDFCFCLNK